MNEKELVLLVTTGEDKKKKGIQLPLAALSLVKADCEMGNRGYRRLHLKRSFLFFRKLPDFI